MTESVVEQQSAEILAINHTNFAQEKKALKEQQFELFKQKTKANADRALTAAKQLKAQQQSQKTLQQREQLLTARDFAAKQRKQAQDHAQLKRVQSAKQVQRDSKPQPDAFVSAKNKVRLADVAESANEHDLTQHSIVQEPKHNPTAERAKVLTMFKQIDTAVVARLGVPKAEISETAIPGLH